jgi:hypothetical protein
MADHQETETAVTGHEPCAVIEAFLDGERVGPHALREALADQEARNHLVDLLMLREAAGAMQPVTSNSAPVRTGTPPRVKWMGAAAAMVAVSLVVGYAAGQRVVASADAPSTVEAILPHEEAVSAPQPTRSIAFVPGVNWTESKGGR